MSAEYFLDTNIVVYAHDSAEQVKQARAQELVFSGMREHNTAVSAQVLSEFLVTVTRKIAVPFSLAAARHVLLLLSHLEVIDLDYDIVLRASRLQQEYQISHWDAMIISAAERCGCTTLFSEDLSHGQKYGKIECQNPFL